MNSSYKENPLVKYPEMFSDFLRIHTVAILFAVVVLVSAFFVLRYGRRRREERRITGEDARMRQVAQIKPKPSRKLHRTNPALPAVTITRNPKYWRSIASRRARWWVGGKDLDVTHLAAISMTETYKNQILFDPCVWNVVRHRGESAVILDVKRDLLEKYGRRLKGVPRFAYDLTGLGPANGINLIETPEMAAITAAALYPVVGLKNPIFNQGARDLFEGLASALGYSRSNIAELFSCLGDPERIMRLAEHDERLKRVVSGPKRELLGDFITSARLPLAALERPEVARVFGPAPGAEQPHFERKETVFICIPSSARAAVERPRAAMRKTVPRAAARKVLWEAFPKSALPTLLPAMATGTRRSARSACPGLATPQRTSTASRAASMQMKNRAIVARKTPLGRPRASSSSATGGPESPVELARSPLTKPMIAAPRCVWAPGRRTRPPACSAAETNKSAHRQLQVVGVHHAQRLGPHCKPGRAASVRRSAAGRSALRQESRATAAAMAAESAPFSTTTVAGS